MSSQLCQSPSLQIIVIITGTLMMNTTYSYKQKQSNEKPDGQADLFVVLREIQSQSTGTVHILVAIDADKGISAFVKGAF